MPYFLGGNSLNRESTHALGILFRFPVLFFERTFLDAVGELVSLGGGFIFRLGVTALPFQPEPGINPGTYDIPVKETVNTLVFRHP